MGVDCTSLIAVKANQVDLGVQQSSHSLLKLCEQFIQPRARSKIFVHFAFCSVAATSPSGSMQNL